MASVMSQIHLAAGAVWAKGQYDEDTTTEMLSYLSEIAAYLVDEGLSPATRARLEAIKNTSAEWCEVEAK
jgi:hypothetical protein